MRLLSQPIIVPSGSPLNSVQVSDFTGFNTQIQDNSVDEIVLTDGVWTIQNAAALATNSLWFGTARGSRPNCVRTRPVKIRPQTPYGVTFDGTGGGSGKWLAFMEGVSSYDWGQFQFANCTVASEGVLKFGGDPTYQSAHHIRVRGHRVLSSCSGTCNPGGSPGDAAGASASALEHGVYFGHGLGGGPHDIQIDEIDVDCRGGLASGIHFFHSAPGIPNAHDLSMSIAKIRQPQQAIMMWDRTVFNVTVDGRDNHPASTSLGLFDEYRWALSWDNVATSDGASGTPSNFVVNNVWDGGTHSGGFSGGTNTNPNGDGSTSAGLTINGGNI